MNVTRRKGVHLGLIVDHIKRKIVFLKEIVKKIRCRRPLIRGVVKDFCRSKMKVKTFYKSDLYLKTQSSRTEGGGGWGWG